MKLQCSVQLATYLRKRRAHMPTEQAAAEAGISLSEARLHDEAERAGEYAHIDTTEIPHLDFERLTAPADGKAPLRASVNVGRDEVGSSPAKDATGATTPQEDNMARSRRKAADEVVEIQKPDFELAKRIYFNDIKPAQSKVGEFAQEQSTAYKEIKKAAHIQPQAAKLAFKLVEMEESKRDDYLRSFSGLLTVFRIFMPRDMVDMAEGKNGGNVVPIGTPERPQLATIGNTDDEQPDWHASLKEGDAVMIPVGDAGSTDVLLGKITFIDGDALDVEYEDAGETVKATIPRDAVSQPKPGDYADDQQIAAE
jgi:hypothetical protein